MSAFSQILWGSLGLSLLHAVIPSHWIPLIVISQAEQWSRAETMLTTALIGLAHTTSTVAVGVLVGLLGYRLASSYELTTRVIAPTILIVMGLLYLFMSLWGSHSHQHGSIACDQPYFKCSGDSKPLSGKHSRLAVIISLGTAMFFSPCFELTTYYFAAGTMGWLGILAVSLVYVSVTIPGMVLLVTLGDKIIKKLKVQLRFLSRYEAVLTSGILIASGISTLVIRA